VGHIDICIIDNAKSNPGTSGEEMRNDKECTFYKVEQNSGILVRDGKNMAGIRG
jgi:hypothetical protein